MTGERVSAAIFGDAVAVDINALANESNARGIMKRGGRNSNSAGVTTTETGVLRLDGILIPASRVYVLDFSPIQVFSTVSGDTVKALVRYSTSGNATTASTVLNATGYIERAHVSGTAGGGTFTIVERLPVVGSDTTYSIILTVIRNSGSGSVNLLAPIEVRVIAYGNDPGDSGVAL
jgi:hypothetical protein